MVDTSPGRKTMQTRATGPAAHDAAPVALREKGSSKRSHARLLAAGMLAAAVLVVLLAGAGCRPPRQRLVIRGGPSLDGLFADLADAFQQQHPNITVVCQFTCPPCIILKRPGQRANCDLFASLGQFELDRLKAVGNLQFHQTVSLGATGLALVTSNKAKVAVRSLADLHKPGLRKIGVGDPKQVAVGYYAKQALSKAGLWQELQSRFVYSQSGCELLKWLGLGRDIDAAIVFSVCTGDNAGSIRDVIDFPPNLIPPVPLLLAVAPGSQNSAAVKAFISFVTSPQARAILSKHKVRPVSGR